MEIVDIFGGEDHIFNNMAVFDKNYIPDKILYRQDEIQQIATALSHILKGGGSFATDCVLYGMRGTGKTLISKHVLSELRKRTLDFRSYYVSFTNTKSEFKALEEILISMGLRNLRGKGFNEGIRLLFDNIKTFKENHIIFIFDEINKVQECDSLLYSFLRPNEVYGDLGEKHISCIFITNDFNFPKNISEGTSSSFSGVKRCIFEPYNANHLRDILTERAKIGLMSEAYDYEVIALCAAFGAQEHGDARQTIKMLGKAAEIAQENHEFKINTEHVRKARQEIELDGMIDFIKLLPPQLKALALAIVKDTKNREKQKITEPLTTGSVYAEYRNICKRIDIEALTQRRIVDLLKELESIGLIEAQVMYLGRKGRTRYINLQSSANAIEKSITSDPRFDAFKPVIIQTKIG